MNLSMIQLMTIYRPMWRKKFDALPKMPWQDVYRTRPGYMGKAGIAGAFDEPARFAARKFVDWYQPERRIKALYQKYHREAKHKVGSQLLRTFYYNKYYAKALPKKNGYSSSNQELQKGTQFRTSFYRRRGSARPASCKWVRQSGSWTRQCYGRSSSNRVYNKVYRNTTGYGKSRRSYDGNPYHYPKARKWTNSY